MICRPNRETHADCYDSPACEVFFVRRGRQRQCVEDARFYAHESAELVTTVVCSPVR